MIDSKKLTITVNITGKDLKVNVDRSVETIYRAAAKAIAQKVAAYQNMVKNMSNEDALRYSLLEATVGNMMAQADENDMSNRIAALAKDLSDTLSQTDR